MKADVHSEGDSMLGSLPHKKIGLKQNEMIKSNNFVLNKGKSLVHVDITLDEDEADEN